MLTIGFVDIPCICRNPGMRQAFKEKVPEVCNAEDVEKYRKIANDLCKDVQGYEPI